MENKFFIASIISITYLIFKFIEMRFVEKENKPLKVLLRDTLLVYFSVVSGLFIFEQVTPVIKENLTHSVNPMVFTDNPEF